MRREPEDKASGHVGSDSRLTCLKGIQGSQVVAAVCGAR